MTEHWFRDREARAFIGLRYQPWLGGLNLAWEALQIAGIEFGVSPLLQWLVLPPLALYLARSKSHAVSA